MTRIIALFILALTFSPSLVSGISAANMDAAWAALHQLDIAKAKELFSAGLTQDPQNEAFKRGSLLAAYFDMDHATAFEMMTSLAAENGSSGYLLPVYELLAAEYGNWADQKALERRLADAMLTSPAAAIRYVGEMANQNNDRTMLLDSGQQYQSRYSTGAWSLGPFDNHSAIAAYRKLPFETTRFDSTADTTGRLGVTAAWWWVEATVWGDVEPMRAFENVEEPAFVLKAFFELPADMDVNLVLGGPYSARVHIDGAEVYDDPIMRNAVVREGLRAHLSKGVHELTFMIASDMSRTNIRFAVRDAEFQPIEGLKWLRYAKVPHKTSQPAQVVHPIFQPFDSLLQVTGTSPDTRFWKAVLQMHNGYATEAVTELETLFDDGKLSNLEQWVLLSACQVKGETQRATELIGRLKESVVAARVDFMWGTVMYTSQPELVNAMATLAEQYPGRPEITVYTHMKKVLAGNYQDFVSGMQGILQEYPNAAQVHELLAGFYQNGIGDNEAALRETEAYYEKTGQKLRRLPDVFDLYMEMGRYDDAIAVARQIQQWSPGADAGLSRLLDASQRGMKLAALEPYFKELAAQYPYNMEIHSNLYSLYRATSQFAQAQQELREIHRLKSTAITPYIQLEELHKNVSYDSLFGTVDVMKLWDVTPSDSELAGEDFWYLLDRRQRLLLSGGPVYNDVHWARVLISDDAVEKDREYRLDIDLNSSFNQLVVARRLRKGQSPLSGEVSGNKVIFKDLRPGDAIEIHYRSWENNSGDLWRDSWRSYYVAGDQYQRYWEYTVLTDRNDVVYTSDPPAPSPKIDTYCGYKRMRWSGENVAGTPTSLELAPPSGTFTGRISTSTVASWQEVNDWYYSVSEAILGDNPRTADLARKLTRGLQSDEEKLAALYGYIALQIPYQLISFDYEGAVPQKPDEVLERRWGDCKDKAHLLIKMLREVGVQAWPVLVLTRETNVDMSVPSVGFDHLIAACKIGTDTLFVDASGTYYPLYHTISWDNALQPRLLIKPGKASQPGKLPALDVTDAAREWRLEVWLSPEVPYQFTMMHTFRGISAGNRRSVLNNYSVSGLKQLFESSYSDTWKANVRLDSLKMDSLISVDSVFSEYWFGKVELDVQTIEQLAIIRPPSWCLFEDGVMAGLTQDGRRAYPIDTRYRTGIARHTMIVHIPAEMGSPTILQPTQAQDSLMQFAYASEWDENERVLTLTYETRIADGMVPLENFQRFAKRVIDIYRKPIVVQPERRP